MAKIVTALSIAGSDCSGGAGIQADLKTFAALGIYGMSAITTVVAENTHAVLCRQDIAPDVLAAQIEAVLDDIPPNAIKIGLLPSAAAVRTVAKALRGCTVPVVLDPVMVASAGQTLHGTDMLEALKAELLPLVTLITPNLAEASALTGLPAESRAQRETAARRLKGLGPGAVLLKGGHLDGAAEDLLFDGERFTTFTRARIDTKNTHGTGCTLSSAIAAYLAQGFELPQAVEQAKAYITGAIAHALPLGRGAGPLGHFYQITQRQKEGR